jgi:hypothetical protein
MEYARAVQLSKNGSYGDAWAKRGWRANLGRLLNKMDRLEHLLWRANPLESGAEQVQETLVDIVNLAAFMYVNYNNGAEWGNDDDRA